MTLTKPLYSYAWAAGKGVALALLNNVESQINQYNRRTANSALKRISIETQPVDEFPIRRMLDSGVERGDGLISVAWKLRLGTLGYKFVLDTYFSSAALVSVPMTISTRIHRLNSYKRYSCDMTLPSQSKGTERHIRSNVWEVTFEFTNLVAL